MFDGASSPPVFWLNVPSLTSSSREGATRPGEDVLFDLEGTPSQDVRSRAPDRFLAAQTCSTRQVQEGRGVLLHRLSVEM